MKKEYTIPAISCIEITVPYILSQSDQRNSVQLTGEKENTLYDNGNTGNPSNARVKRFDFDDSWE